MGLVLDPPRQRALEDRPTSNPDAYDFYLRGNDYFTRGNTPEDVSLAGQMYQRAIGLDSSFAQAWARLSKMHSAQFWYFYDRSQARLAQAKAAADRALRLRPDLPEGHEALGYYFYWGKLDYDRALQEIAVARRAQPNNGDLIFAIAVIQRRQGRWLEAEANFVKSAQLDPRSPLILFNLAETYNALRKYDQARRETERAISLTPERPVAYWGKIEAVLGSGGSVDEADQTLREGIARTGFLGMARAVAATSSVAAFAVMPSFLLTVSPVHQLEVERLALPEFEDTVGYYHLKAEMYRARKQPKLETAYLDSARAVLESQVRAQPDEASFHSRLGVIDAYLGRKADAVREGETAVRLLPISKEAYRGANILAALALIYATVGRRAEAVDRLEYLVTIPSQISRGMLRNDPRWAMLRGDPRFERLIARK
jgi:serine/threonine-protein kinase